MAPVSLWCVLAGFLASSSASLVKHSLPGVPAGWAEVLDAPLVPSQGLNLRFGLAQHRFSHLESLLLNISNPSHPNYGKHLSKEQVDTLSTPSNDTLEIVEGWLLAHKASSVKWSPSKDSVSAVVSVSSTESMLFTRFGIFEHVKSGRRVVRTLSYSLPESLAPHIDFIHPTTAFLDPLRHGMREIGSNLKRAEPVALNQSDFISCFSVVDPPCVRKLYNVGNYTPDASLPNHIGVAGYLDIWSRPDSFALYLNDYVPESIGSNYTFDVVNITGPFPTPQISDEGNLDTQMGQSFAYMKVYTGVKNEDSAIQVAYPIPMTYYTTNSVPPYIPDQNQDGFFPGVNEPYLDFIDYIMALDNPPTVITTSYGDDEQTVPKDYANAVCQGFAKLGARGVSVLFSSGDEGLGINDLPTCIANTGNNATTFLPDFPASCPYVTVFNSGAGFSYYFDRPAYQEFAVSNYLAGPANRNETALQSSMYNHNGRAYPDMVLVGGSAFFDYFFNRWDIQEGTSVSVPTAASVIALLNDWRLRNGKPTMGFLNPFLYGVGSQGFTDITAGLVNGCEQPGFNATEGWDVATGLGIPDFQKLQYLALL
ncbi:tripeptidyl peptidase A [Mycena galericulata]|nr:tripeptidyl peptidase A [Mycena galericulata]